MLPITFHDIIIYPYLLFIFIVVIIYLLSFIRFFLSIANISACYLGSAQTNKQAVMDGILAGEYRLVYITPEYVTGNNHFLKRLAEKVGNYV